MTTRTESFNTADSTTLGPDQSWTEVSGSWEVHSNQAGLNETSNTNFRSARCGGDIGSTDMYAQCVVAAMPVLGSINAAGPCVRFADAANTYYCAEYLSGSTSSTFIVRIAKVVTGTRTQLGSGVTVTFNAGDVVKLTCAGSTLTTYLNGTQQEQITDTSITTGTKAGLELRNRSATAFAVLVDNFEAGVFAALVTGSATITGAGSQTIAGYATKTGVAAVSGLGAQTIAGYQSASGLSALSATSGLVVTGAHQAFGVSAISGLGGLTVSGDVTSPFGAPTGLMATPNGAHEIDLEWNAVDGADGYDIERDGSIIVSSHPAITYDDTGLDPVTLYTYRVRAVAT